MSEEALCESRDPATACPHNGHALPCAGCPEAVASVSRIGRGNDLMRSDHDGCWVVRIDHSEKLRSDDPCLACSFFRNRAQLLAG
ncbi:hypothetical protein CCC_03350 [Paramagnetospirillum magnetotacticum MS-1]|uniref:Uncharacterized protein n=1 Tax=Paramagnetospirillum magnetotacticum MS-1 TaxID=272627 RepID=A0A0C2UCC2_PARME|nr:hypothetical protein [Paramagnetospirillum magnetotacticum]KIL99132.1 hypothetical protein CCC_03350 [Paramagnetospirillum magnetotacticum MS-1]